jgi:hypothetical protein
VLPLLLTTLLALYVLGPDLVSRWILGFVVPRRAVIQSKSEEVARAILWSLIPLAFAWFWAIHLGNLLRCGGGHELSTLFSGLYSESFFTAHRSAFFAAATAFFWMNWCLLWRLYLMVVLGAVALTFVIRNYGRIRRMLDHRQRLQNLLATVVLPRVSDWHVLLSGMLLPSRDLRIFVDVLARSGNLYQGRLADKTLGPDGMLVTVTLAEPSKFRREQYVEDRKTQPSLQSDAYWKRIPGEMFLILAADITTINVRYVQSTITRETAPEIIDALRDLLGKLEDTTK